MCRRWSGSAPARKEPASQQAKRFLEHAAALAGLADILVIPGCSDRSSISYPESDQLRLDFNIEHYKQPLAGETDPSKREPVNRQLAEQEVKLQEKDRKERGG